MKPEPQGLERWANTDPSLHCNIIEPSGPDWRNEYMKLLIEKDHEAAHKLRVQNDPVYASEVEPQVTVMKTRHAPLRSCAQVELDRQLRQEAEEAA